MKKNKICLNCNKLKTNIRTKYCDNECLQKFRYRTFIERWKQGLESGRRGQYNISKYIRKYLFKKYSNKCVECEWSKINSYTNKIPLEVDHIDGNFKNNKENNLKLLCPNCHSLTSTYKGANRGNGRFERKQRYQEGKSY